MKKIEVKYIPGVYHGAFHKSIFGGYYLTEWVPGWYKKAQSLLKGDKRNG